MLYTQLIYYQETLPQTLSLLSQHHKTPPISLTFSHFFAISFSISFSTKRCVNSVFSEPLIGGSGDVVVVQTWLLLFNTVGLATNEGATSKSSIPTTILGHIQIFPLTRTNHFPYTPLWLLPWSALCSPAAAAALSGQLSVRSVQQWALSSVINHYTAGRC